MIRIASLLFLSVLCVCATAAANNFYGLARNSAPVPSIYLAKMDVATGTVTNIGTTSVSPTLNLTGAALDPYRNQFHFIGFSNVLSIDLSNGSITGNNPINNPLGDSYFDNFRFNNSDSSLYGLSRRNYYDSTLQTIVGEMYLSTLDPATGTIREISTSSVGSGYALTGSAIDPYQMIYYYSTGPNLVGIDMYTGSIYSSVPMSVAAAGADFENFTYNCADTTIYGIVKKNYISTVYDSTLMRYVQQFDSSSFKLGKIDPQTGNVTLISPYSIGVSSYTINGSSTIDPDLGIYYFNTGNKLAGISLATGLLVTNQTINNPDGQYFDMMRIQSDCIQATTPKRLNVGTSVPETGVSASGPECFPNPFSETIHIRGLNGNEKITLIDAEGKMINETEAASDKIQLDMNPYGRGIYFLKISGPQGSQILKAVK